MEMQANPSTAYVEPTACRTLCAIETEEGSSTEVQEDTISESKAYEVVVA